MYHQIVIATVMYRLFYSFSLYIMDTLGPTKCLDYQGALIFQVILFDLVPFGT